MQRRVGLDRRWTVPNALSVARLFLAGWFVLLLCSAHNRVGGCIVLGIAGVTDFFDGVIARRFNQISKLGKILDPTVDRVVLGTAVIAMVVSGVLPVWLTVIVMAREGLLLVGAAVLCAKGVRRIEVLPVGKAGTFGLMVVFPLFVLGDTSGTFALVLRSIAWVLVLPSLAASWYAAFSYVPYARGAVREAEQTTLQPTS